MKTHLIRISFAAGAALVAAAGLAQPSALAANGANAQSQDEAECSALATQQTGFNPSAPPPPVAQAAPATGSGSRAKGAAVGATVGAVSGGDVGQAAAAGAVAGGVARRSGNRRDARAANEANAQASQAGSAAYQQARAACLAARNPATK